MLYYRKHEVDKNGNFIKVNDKYVFRIVDSKDSKITDKEVLQYIESLKIPPAYRDTKIFYINKPKILFEGYDDKNRLQQIYSQDHKKKASKKKFCHLLNFGKILPKIIKDMEKNIKYDLFEEKYDSSKQKLKLIAIIIKIVINCGFRLGNLKYQKLYKSFGISNILLKHIAIKIKNNHEHLHINFIGKKGVKNNCIIDNKQIIHEIKQLIVNKEKTDHVFTYKLDDKTHLLTSNDINKWLKTYDSTITSKMFRTWDTNVLFLSLIKEKDINGTQARRKKNVIEILRIVADHINNTPNVCKKEYMLNDIWQIYIDQPIRYKKMFFNEPIEDLIKYLEKYCN